MARWLGRNRRRPLRIAAAHPPGTANSAYRAVIPLRALEQRGHEIVWPDDHELKSMAYGVPQWDLLHLHQFCSEEDIAHVERLREQGIAVIWDCDDDWTEMPRTSPLYRTLRGRRQVLQLFERSVRIASAASVMTTTSTHLANVYRAAGVERIEVIENYVHEQSRPARAAGSGVVIGLCAALEHQADLDALGIARALQRLLDERPDVSVRTIGLSLQLRSPRYRNTRGVPLEQLIVAEAEFDVALAPLTDIPFNRARSNIKLKEYVTAGAMWLASPVGPYRGLGEEQGGLLVPDGEWEATLRALLDDAPRRAQLTKRARRWAKEVTIASGVERWERLVYDLVQRSS